MLSVAKKYNVTLDPPLVDVQLRREMPAWYHKGTKVTRRIASEGEWAVCQNVVHEITTMGQLADFATQALPPNHRNRRNCRCQVCKAQRNRGCTDPIKCRAAAGASLDGLPKRWDPRKRKRAPPRDEYAPGSRPSLAYTDKEPVIMDSNINSKPTVWEEFRVFGEETPRKETPARRRTKDAHPSAASVEVAVLARSRNSREIETSYNGGLWFGNGDERNKRI
ncbi:hypothetical protein CPC08DRAFT_651660, partial [Agrocybe pediades]